jgi:pimeloyl-ACP methyl ester carboxylesterase
LSVDRESQQLTLSDGRVLGYAEYGTPDGAPVLYFHGFPGSRLEAVLTHGPAAALGARIIAVDRPGYGLSDPKPDREIGSWSHDVDQLANRLGLQRFAVLGVSGGGPYAMACAARLAGRLTHVGLICSLGPLDRPGAMLGMPWHAQVAVSMARHAPALMAWTWSAIATRLMASDPEQVIAGLSLMTPAPDQSVLRVPSVRRSLANSFREALRNGPHGPAEDLKLYCRPWDIRPEAVLVEVDLWHGELDETVPASHGRYLAQAIPRCRPRFLKGEGHYSLPIRHMELILRAVLSP